MDGIIIVNKPIGMTSHDVVGKLRKILKTKKVGHCGTLDPQASGVLVVCVNKATKIIQFLTAQEKEYQAVLYLGKSTTTYDKEGYVVDCKEYKDQYTKEEIQTVLNTFLGTSKQLPPIYSAIKVNGKKLYEYAREGLEVEIEEREIHINEINVISVKDHLIEFKVKCSKGTYIRSLCFDIAKKLGYPGYMDDLVRLQSGDFHIDKAYTLEQIENQEFEILPLETGLSRYTKYVTDKEEDVLCGKKLELDYNERVVVYNQQGKALAVYEPYQQGIMRSIRGLW